MTIALENQFTDLWLCITFLGGSLFLSITTLFLYLHCLVAKRKLDGIYVAFTYVGGEVIVHVLKEIFQRQRPPLDQMLTFVSTYSFPSGHAFLTAAISISIIILDWAHAERSGGKVALLLIVPLAVGLSRVALGVHYVTDVIGGWILGTLWAIMCYNILKKSTAKNSK